jgi:hypothetical protein
MNQSSKRCSRCKKNVSTEGFDTKLDGAMNKCCKECLVKHKIISEKNKCEHGKRRTICRECSGTGICAHNRQRYTCKPCNGASICEHNQRRYDCKDCKDPIDITVKNMIHTSKTTDIKYNRYDEKNQVDKGFLHSLIASSPRCYYEDCSVKLQYTTRQHDLGTIERLNNNIGHTKDNCVIACWKCNVSVRSKATTF